MHTIIFLVPFRVSFFVSLSITWKKNWIVNRIICILYNIQYKWYWFNGFQSSLFSSIGDFLWIKFIVEFCQFTVPYLMQIKFQFTHTYITHKNCLVGLQWAPASHIEWASNNETVNMFKSISYLCLLIIYKQEWRSFDLSSKNLEKTNNNKIEIESYWQNICRN